MELYGTAVRHGMEEKREEILLTMSRCIGIAYRGVLHGASHGHPALLDQFDLIVAAIAHRRTESVHVFVVKPGWKARVVQWLIGNRIVDDGCDDEIAPSG